MARNSRAWVTFVTGEESVIIKALILAGSLKRMCTAHKTIVFVPPTLDKERSDKLMEAFDMVIPLTGLSSGLEVVEEALVRALALKMFEKCIFLSPHCMFLKNCDDLHEKVSCFGINGCDDDKEHAQLVGFVPSLAHSKSLRDALQLKKENGNKGFSHRKLLTWAQNNFAAIHQFDEKYNVKLNRSGKVAKCLEPDGAIVSFGNEHPKDIINLIDNGRCLNTSVIELQAVEMLRLIFAQITELVSPVETQFLTHSGSGEPIAVVGMSCRLPGANNLEEFWNILSNGENAVRPVPPFRWQRNQSLIPSKNKSVQAGFLNTPIDEFDCKFFGISPRESELLDPQQRLLHEVTWEALEDALIDPLQLKGTRTGFFVGTWIYDYKEIALRVPDFDFYRAYMGNSVAASAARLSHFFETTGPSIGTESGCSSSIAAVHMACKSLQNGESNLAVAGGANLIIHPFENSNLGFILAPDGRCKTFDSQADGFARAEGICSVVLKRLSDAVRDGDNIWGLIKGSAVVQEGPSRSMGTPTIRCEALAMELALKDAGVKAEEVSFVEAHGTGTPVGDPMEIAAITKVYGGRKNPLYIGSVKTNIGHTEAVSGLAGLIKVLLAMKHEVIPAHLNFDEINPDIDLDSIPAQIPLSPVDWKKMSNIPRVCGVSSFGISGTDGHLIIQEPPAKIAGKSTNGRLERTLHILKLSAKCKESLEILIEKYENILKDSPLDFGDVAHTANIGRAEFSHRTSIIAANSLEAVTIMKEKRYKVAEVSGSGVQKLCFLFTGQGSQYPGMAKQLNDTSPVFQSHFRECCSLLKEFCEIELYQIIMEPNSNSPELINKTLYSQTSIFVVEYCLLKLWESWGIKPDYVLGHSLGEFAAAVAVGALDLHTALELVAKRSILIDSLPEGKMVVVKANARIVSNMINDFKVAHPNFLLEVAAINSPEQTVLAGDAENVVEFSKHCETKYVKSILLASTHAFHSRHMEPILEEYSKAASSALGKRSPETAIKTDCQYISGVEGKFIETETLLDKEYWRKHCREKVNFMDACRTAQKEEICLFLEIGPHPILSALVMSNMEGRSVSCIPSIRKSEENWNTLLGSLEKLWVSEWQGTIDWKGFDKYYNREKVSLPFYPFIKRSIWAEMQPHSDWPLIPLLGSVVCSPSNVALFNNYITVKRFSYLNDHTILNKVVFPAAAFMEICLCAGHAAVQGYTEDFMKPHRPVGLKDLQIVAPFGINENSASKVQTVVKMETEEETGATVYKAEVYHWLEEQDGAKGGKWILHASSSFLPVIPGSKLGENLNIEQIRNGLESKEWNIQEVYEATPELGLRFGSTFQTLKRGWGGENEEGGLFEVKLSLGQREECLIHPVIGDAMIQATMIWRRKITGEGKKKRLQVPVRIGEFVWFPNEILGATQDLFIYCQADDDNFGNITAVLISTEGQLLGRMSGVEFIDTTAKLVLGMIQQQSVHMPNIWEEITRENPGSIESSIPSEIWEKAPRLPDDEDDWMDSGRPGEHAMLEFNHISKLATYQILKALLDLGWAPKLREKFSMEQIVSSLKIKDIFRKYIDFFFNQMAGENWISKGVVEEYIVEEGLLTEIPQIEKFLSSVVTPKEPSRCDYRMVSEIGRSLAEILIGKVDPLTLVFPEDPTKPTAQGIYDLVASEVEPAYRRANHVLAESFPMIKANSPSNILKILEIGGGTGMNSRIVLDSLLPALTEQNLKLEYVFTDISPAFFTLARKNLEEYLGQVDIKFKKLDIEGDPFSQGFCPEYFDVVLSAEVLHATRDIRETVRNIEKLVKPSGSIQIVETVKDDPAIMFIFGLLDGYWRFRDFDLRTKSPVLSGEKWTMILEQEGFTEVKWLPTWNGMHAGIYGYRQANPLKIVAEQKCQQLWLVFGDDFTQSFVQTLDVRMRQIGKNLVYIRRPFGVMGEVEMKQFMKEKLKLATSKGVEFEGILYLWGMVSEDEHDQTQISLPLVSLYQELLSSTLPPKLFIVTYGNDNPSESTLLGMSKSIVIEHNHNSKGGKICLERGEKLNTQVKQVFTNLWNSSNYIEYFEFKGEKRFVKRLKTRKLLNNELILPTASSERFQLVIPSTRQISDLEFTHLDPYELEGDQVEVRVKAMALNFRDIFSVLKPIPLFDNINTIGLDFAGVITQVGPLVDGFNPGDFVICTNFDKNLALPSHVKVGQDYVAKLPEEMTFCEGATLPTAFVTAIYCLIDTGRLGEGETILIHAASGGVGLAAIQLAKEVKANIIATAGSDRKRAYLRSIGITHVFNSRTTEFSQQILDVTKGKGVDIVLNSLTSPGFKEATLQALGQGGRFIEMSKLQIWEKEEVAEIRPDVEYHVVDLSVLDVKTFKTVLNNIRGRIEGRDTNSIQALLYDRFDALDIRAALHHLQQAKHIGKVVCVMPERVPRENSKVKTVVPLFNDRSTYIVTGGLGGIGFEVVKWMLRNGAKYIAIVSRSLEPKPEIAGQIKKFNEEDGKQVQHFSLDVSDFEKCSSLFETIQNPGSSFPKIRGIMHAAGILDDATFENQNWEKFNSTYKTKVEGSWNLHLLTKSLNLEHFVMFSSIASVLGAPGQANYSASNSFQDGLALFRNSQGLPAITINWGNWGEVGIATEVDFPGVRPISTSQGLLLLSSVLKAPNATQLIAANIDSFSLLSQLIPNVKQYMDDSSLFGVQKTQLAAVSSDEFWAEVDAAQDREEKLEVFKKHIKIFVRNLLKMEVDEPISDTVDFQSLGIDSLMMLEMKNSLQNVLGSRLIITASQLRDCNNVQLLANRFLDIIESKEEETLMPTLEELRVLIREDCRLLDEVIIEPNLVPFTKESEIQTVFVTGVTGNLGGYILKDICRIPTIQKIYCLVRPRGNLSASERLKEIMNKRGVEEKSIDVIPIEGDIGKDNFGVNEEMYEKLALEIDAVIHCAAKSDHIAKYWKAPANRLANIRNINVLGTKRVLEFASHLKTKHVFYASALVITTTVNDDDTLSEDWQGDNAFDSVSYNSGYAISKFVSEQLVKQAWERGIPCKSFRFALVTGDGKTGELDILSSHYMIRLLAFMKLGCMPDSPIPSLLITPDSCSKALAHLCFNEKVPSGVYNVVPPHPQLEQVFVDVAMEFGVKIEIVSVEDFLQKLRMEGDDSPIAPLKRIYTEADNSSLEVAQNISSIHHWMENSSGEFFISKKLKELMPKGFLDGIELASEIMRRDIRYAKRSGAFEMVGIKLAEK